MKAIGEELKRCRLERGWSAENLAAQAGIHRNSVYRYEAGGKMDFHVFVDLCVVLGVNAGELLSRVLTVPGAQDSEASRQLHSQ